MDLYLFNRGESSKKRSIPEGANVLIGDINNTKSMVKVLDEHAFDVVVNWIAYTPDQVQRDIQLFQNRTDQYIFISSASAYEKPVRQFPITEETPLVNPFWEYSQNKADCETFLMKAHVEEGFPITIVRPSHTYDKTLFPFRGGYTVLDRMRKGQPVVVHGDGESHWVLTQHYDFAVGFSGLLGKTEALGEAYHITSDEQLTWNQIYATVAEKAGAEFKPVHVPPEFIARYDPDWGASLLGDKSHSVSFDNTKIRKLVPEFVRQAPFAEGCEEIIGWHDADAGRRIVSEDFSKMLDRIIGEYDKF